MQLVCEQTGANRANRQLQTDRYKFMGINRWVHYHMTSGPLSFPGDLQAFCIQNSLETQPLEFCTGIEMRALVAVSEAAG